MNVFTGISHQCPLPPESGRGEALLISQGKVGYRTEITRNDRRRGGTLYVRTEFQRVVTGSNKLRGRWNTQFNELIAVGHHDAHAARAADRTQRTRHCCGGRPP